MRHTMTVERMTKKMFPFVASSEAAVGKLAVVERMGGDIVKICATSDDVRRGFAKNYWRRKGVRSMAVILGNMADQYALSYGATRS